MKSRSDDLARRILLIAKDGRERTVTDFKHRLPLDSETAIRTALRKLARDGRLAGRTIPVSPSVQTYTLAERVGGTADARKAAPLSDIGRVGPPQRAAGGMA